MNQEDRDPYDYFRDEITPKKTEQPTSDDIVNSLRSDLLIASIVEPEEETIVQQVNPKLIMGIAIGGAVLCWFIFLVIGPGRSMLESGLKRLKSNVPTPTQQIMSTISTATYTPIVPSSTPTHIPTIHPTNTSVVEIVTSPTPMPPITTPTSESTCRDVLTITEADVGQTVCVRGTIIETITYPTYFMVIFNPAKASFYWVTYDLVWSQAELNNCYQTTGKIDQIGISPVLVFGYNTLPEPCP